MEGEAECEGDLQDLLLAAADEPDGDLWPVAQKVEDVVTFEAAGVLTANKGLVVKLDDGSEFQLTIVQSKEARA